MMFTFGYKSKMSSILRACAAIAVGLVMVLSNNATTRVVQIIGALLFAAGVITFAYTRFIKKAQQGSLNDFNAVVDVVLGLILFVAPGFAGDVILLVIGIALTVLAIIQILAIVGTVSLVGMGPLSLVVSALALVGGLMLVFNPFSQFVMEKIAGAALIIYGCSEFASAWRMEKAKKASEVNFNQEYTSAEYTHAEDAPRTQIGTDFLSDAKEVDFEKE